MKFAVKKNFILPAMLCALAIILIGCGAKPNAANSEPTAPVGGAAASPTEGYEKLFAAVKSKNTDAIKATMTKATLGFAEASAQRTNQTLPEMLKNGLTATTLTGSLPAIRDERIKDKMGAVEVYNSTDSRWEDLPFILEDGSWKLAVGELFANTYVSPGKGRAALEAEAANKMTIINTNGAGNFVSGKRLNANSMSETAPAVNANK